MRRNKLMLTTLMAVLVGALFVAACNDAPSPTAPPPPTEGSTAAPGSAGLVAGEPGGVPEADFDPGVTGQAVTIEMAAMGGQADPPPRQCESVTGRGNGLCVAWFAQGCEETPDSPSCEQIAENYESIMGAPPPWIIRECPCWTEDELDEIAGELEDRCIFEDYGAPYYYWELEGKLANGVSESAYVARLLQDPQDLCIYKERSDGPIIFRWIWISPAEAATCRSSLETECADRGL